MAIIKAEAIRESELIYDICIRAHGKLSDDSLYFAVSLAVSQWQDGWTAQVSAVDSALHEAKDTDRNQVRAA